LLVLGHLWAAPLVNIWQHLFASAGVVDFTDKMRWLQWAATICEKLDGQQCGQSFTTLHCTLVKSLGEGAGKYVCTPCSSYHLPLLPEFWSVTCKSARRLTVDGTFATAAFAAGFFLLYLHSSYFYCYFLCLSFFMCVCECMCVCV